MAVAYRSRNDMPEEIRAQVIDILNARLAESLDLQSQIKQAHWNAKGRNFIGFHELMDMIHAAVLVYTDDIAERATALGGIVNGTVRDAAKESALNEYPHEIVTVPEHVEAISNSLAQFGKNVRQSIDETDELQDKDTADLFTEISRGIDKYLWLVEAHTQDEKKIA